MLSISEICKTYKSGGVKALDSFSFDFEAGKVHLVKGRSGSGKSTLLMIAGAMMKADSGSVLFEGNDVYRMSRFSRNSFRNKMIGFIFQKFHLLPYLDVRKNIMLSQYLRSRAWDSGNISRLASELDLADRLDHMPSELSVGQQQRVAIARALAGNPKIILADEPTGNLDDENASVVAQILKNEAKKGKIVIVATHERSLSSIADIELNLFRGKLENSPYGFSDK